MLSKVNTKFTIGMTCGAGPEHANKNKPRHVEERKSLKKIPSPLIKEEFIMSSVDKLHSILRSKFKHILAQEGDKLRCMSSVKTKLPVNLAASVPKKIATATATQPSRGMRPVFVIGIVFLVILIAVCAVSLFSAS